jgi:hypothetical protein
MDVSDNVSGSIIGPRVGISLCFAISGLIFFILLLDSHYKCIKTTMINTVEAAMKD